MLQRSACGFGSLALAGLAHQDAQGRDRTPNDLRPREPMFPARAKRVIFIFMQGGPSQIDTFDYKPDLIKNDGQDIDFTGVRFGTFGTRSKRKLLKPLWKFQQHGECDQ